MSNSVENHVAFLLWVLKIIRLTILILKIMTIIIIIIIIVLINRKLFPWDAQGASSSPSQ